MVACARPLESDARHWNLLGFADDAPKLQGTIVGGIPVSGTIDECVARTSGREIWFCCGIGNNAIRKRLAEKLERAGWRAATLIAPTAVVAATAIVGDGTYLGHQCFVGPEARIGRHALINVHASVGHHSVLGDYAQVCPGACVSGLAQIGEGGFVGSNGVLAPGVSIGRWSVVAAASLAARNLGEGATAIGVPARELPRQP